MSVLFLDKQSNHDLNKQLLITGIIFIAITPSALDAFPEMSSENLADVKTINFIDSLQISKNVNMLEAEGGLNIYLEPNFQRVAEYDKNSSFDSFLSQNNINMIVLSDMLENDSRFENDNEWLYFLENYADIGYLMKEIPNTNRQLIYDLNLLP